MQRMCGSCITSGIKAHYSILCIAVVVIFLAKLRSTLCLIGSSFCSTQRTDKCFLCNKREQWVQCLVDSS